MPDKLTDKEIVKALEICSTYKASCKNCPAFVKVDRSNCKKVLIGAKDLINRLQAENKTQSIMIKMLEGSTEDYKNSYINQKAENERLQEAIDEQDIEISRLYKRIDKAKTEAYKEFAERLKENSIATFSFKGVVMVEEIDDLLKELIGE